MIIMKYLTHIITICALILTEAVFAQTQDIQIKGPDENIDVTISLIEGKLFYKASFKKKPVLDSSPLSININNELYDGGTSFGSVTRSSTNESYEWRGMQSNAVSNSNTVIIPVQGSRPLNLEVKVFNDGFAFRYIINRSGNSSVLAENTGFIIPEGSIVWSQSSIRSYEGTYLEQKIEEVPVGQLAGPPLTYRLSNKAGYVSITEGGLIDFAGMSLIAEAGRKYKANLTGSVNKTGLVETPWRVVQIAADLNTLMNCNIVNHVSPAYDNKLFPEGFKTSWVKPGRSVWSWLAGNGGVTYENMKKYSKWAGELGFEYNLVDEGWNKWNDGGKSSWDLLKDLVTYSDQQKVKIWLWKAYPDRDGIAGLKNAADRLTFFRKCKEVGVVGIKLDFFDTESQEVIKFYQAALKDAAELGLMLNFHGSNKPTGETRTWPNEMSREGIRGLENGTSWPKHNTTLLFTRFLAGHGDFTPLSFRTVANGTTVTHQVSTIAAFNSPFMCLAVNPEALLNHPSKSIVKDIPVVWDETIVLPPSEIAELGLLAKRSGTTWYVVALNGELKKDIQIDLSFLGKGEYIGLSMEDSNEGPSNAIFKSTEKITANTKLNVSLHSGGGYLARLKLVTKQVNVTPEESPSEELSIFPNPTNNEISISYKGTGVSKIYASVYNLNGKKIMSNLEFNDKGLLKVNTSDLFSSTYIVRVTDNDENILARTKFIKQ